MEEIWAGLLNVAFFSPRHFCDPGLKSCQERDVVSKRQDSLYNQQHL